MLYFHTRSRRATRASQFQRTAKFVLDCYKTIMDKNVRSRDSFC